MKLLGTYQNGNCNVSIYDDGTKIRETEDDCFIPRFPESIDLKITNYCDMNCPYCHEGSNKLGQHANLNHEFIETLQPYTELAVGGGNPLAHPNLREFLGRLKEKNIVVNMTVNQHHFITCNNRLQELMGEKLIYGLGVSFTEPTVKLVEVYKAFPKKENIVFHLINGVAKKSHFDILALLNAKILILGYKQLRRGNDFYSDEVDNNKKILYKNIGEYLQGGEFRVVSFDNLAIEQLNMRRFFTGEKWESFYMGDDGQFTMYVDLVNEQFSTSSTSEKRFDLLPDIEYMFGVVRNERKDARQ